VPAAASDEEIMRQFGATKVTNKQLAALEEEFDADG
jgi:hypothetical protein